MVEIIHALGKATQARPLKKFGSDVQLIGSAKIQLKRPKMHVEICEVLDHIVGGLVYRLSVVSTEETCQISSKTLVSSPNLKPKVIADPISLSVHPRPMPMDKTIP